VWGQLQTLLSKHPTWKNQIDSVDSFMITTGFNKTCTVLKIKPAWSKKYITISWRKCKPPRVLKTKNKISDDQITVDEITNITETVDTSETAGTTAGTVDTTDTVDTAEAQSTTPHLTPQLSGAMRSAIGRQVASWKQANQVFRRCRKCQSPLNLHVDHVIPFVQLQRDFLKLQPEIPTSFFYMRKTCQPRFTDKGFARKWQFYHRKHAQLQWLCRTCNLKKGSSDSVRS
jgi:5-methylcytosine-specific restriction endonuclease McrA